MYEQIKKEAIRVGMEIEKNIALCQQLKNRPKQYVSYRKTQAKSIPMNNNIIIPPQKEEGESNINEKADELVKRINQSLLSRRNDQLIRNKQELQRYKIQNLNLKKESLQIKSKLILKEQAIARLQNDFKQYKENQFVNRSIWESNQQDLIKQKQALQAANRNLQQKHIEFQSKIEKYIEINKKLSEQLRIRREQSYQLNRFNQRVQQKIQSQSKEMQILNAKIALIIKKGDQQLQKQSMKNINLNNTIIFLKSQIEKLTAANQQKDENIKQLQENLYNQREINKEKGMHSQQIIEKLNEYIEVIKQELEKQKQQRAKQTNQWSNDKEEISRQLEAQRENVRLLEKEKVLLRIQKEQQNQEKRRKEQQNDRILNDLLNEMKQMKKQQKIRQNRNLKIEKQYEHSSEIQIKKIMKKDIGVQRQRQSKYENKGIQISVQKNLADYNSQSQIQQMKQKDKRQIAIQSESFEPQRVPFIDVAIQSESFEPQRVPFIDVAIQSESFEPQRVPFIDVAIQSESFEPQRVPFIDVAIQSESFEPQRVPFIDVAIQSESFEPQRVPFIDVAIQSESFEPQRVPFIDVAIQSESFEPQRVPFIDVAIQSESFEPQRVPFIDVAIQSESFEPQRVPFIDVAIQSESFEPQRVPFIDVAIQSESFEPQRVPFIDVAIQSESFEPQRVPFIDVAIQSESFEPQRVPFIDVAIQSESFEPQRVPFIDVAIQSESFEPQRVPFIDVAIQSESFEPQRVPFIDVAIQSESFEPQRVPFIDVAIQSESFEPQRVPFIDVAIQSESFEPQRVPFIDVAIQSILQRLSFSSIGLQAGPSHSYLVSSSCQTQQSSSFSYPFQVPLLQNKSSKTSSYYRKSYVKPQFSLSQLDNSELNRGRIQSIELINQPDQLSSIKLLQQQQLMIFSKKSSPQLKSLFTEYRLRSSKSTHQKQDPQIFKINYLSLESKYLYLTKLYEEKENKLMALTNKIIAQQTEIDTLKIHNNQIKELKIRIQQLQKPLCPHDKNINLQVQNLQKLINRINKNCLKNNCDSAAIISISINKFSNKAVDFIHLSPTDLQKFNNKQDLISIPMHPLQQIHLQYKSQRYINGIERKKSFQSESNPIPPKPSKQLKNVQSPNQKEEKSISIENNPDSQITLTYQQLKNKYHQLYRENQKMSEYLCSLQIINHKWKKSTSELQHHSKVNVLTKLSERLTALLFHKEKALSIENHQLLVAQLVSLIKQIQNYVHFLDHLIKIQPFQDHYRTPYHFKKLKKPTIHIKSQKQVIRQKTYSQGGSRQDQLIQIFDIYPYQTDQIPHAQELRQQKGKKQMQQFQKIQVQQNEFPYTDISSVKNQSQQSQTSSFMHSKTELAQLGQYLKSNKKKIEQIDQQFALKKDHDISKAQPKSFNQLWHLYLKLKDDNEELLKERSQYQKLYNKQIEKIENQHAKKISKIVKQFNQVFALLCQRSNPPPIKQKINKKNSANQEIQVEPNQPQIRKRSQSRLLSQQGSSKAKTQQLIDTVTKELQDQIRQAEERNKEQSLQLQRSRETVNSLNKKLNQKMQSEKSNQLIISTQQQIITKEQKDLQQFINKIIKKNATNPSLSLATIIQPHKSFRKNSSSINPNQYVLATKISQTKINIQDILQILCEQFQVQNKSEWNTNISFAQLKKLIHSTIQANKLQTCKQILKILTEKLECLINKELDDWCQYFEDCRLSLYEGLGQRELVDLMIHHLNQITVKLRKENAESVASLSIYSKTNEQDYLKDQIEEKAVRKSQEDLRRQIQELKSMNESLKNRYSEINSLCLTKQQLILDLKQQLAHQSQQLANKNKYSPLQIILKEKEKQIICLQQEILALREQATKLRHKQKKTKIYHIQN